MKDLNPPSLVAQAEAAPKQHPRKRCSNAPPVIGYDDVPNGYRIVDEQ